jgi:hypothetical protein
MVKSAAKAAGINEAVSPSCMDGSIRFIVPPGAISERASVAQHLEKRASCSGTRATTNSELTRTAPELLQLSMG